MSNFDLLDAVLPSEGRYCIVGIGRYVDQKLVDSKEEAEARIKELAPNFNVYFGCAKFGSLNNRKHENAKYFRALWIDIDCGEEKAKPDDDGIIKGYIDQSTGMSELKRFCKELNLPKPILINSGYGIHVYWLLEETLTQAQWNPLAKRLRQLCVKHNLIVDASVFEASRVLRVPGTNNYKFKDDPKEVTVINETCDRIPVATFAELLGSPEPELNEDRPDFIPASMSPMMEALLQNKIKRFSTIMIKSAQGTGCAQLLYCYQNQDKVGYNLWRAALSIAAFCVDKETAVHKMSKDHPEYDRYASEIKADDIGGPHHCVTFEKHRPGGCNGCPHKGKFKSPIMLGVEVGEADANEVEVITEDGEVTTLDIPEYPFPFFRGKSCGVYKRPPPGEEEEAKLVYEHDLYLHKRMIDPVLGDVAVVRLHLPRDGVKEFSMTAADICSKDKLRQVLAQNGVYTHKGQYEDLSMYIVASLKSIQYDKKAETMRTQFGWTEGDSKFILGDREITKDGIFYSPPSTYTKTIADLLTPKGSFEEWKKVFDLYGRPGLEANAFGALTAFGSPLLKFTGMNGAIINLIHQSAGTGKSTVLYMCNSVYGHPTELGSMWKDTYNAKIHRLGVMNNLPNTLDEITNTLPQEFSDLAYSISQGRGKNRMKSSANEERVNISSWQGITLASSNASFYEKLATLKSSPDGENMRLLEYHVKKADSIDTQEGKHMFDHVLRDNYGHAGDVYIQHLVNNLESTKQLLRKVQAKIDRDVQFSSRERFWSAVAACNITGGLVAWKLGLHTWNMTVIYDWLVNMLNEMREEIKPPTLNPLMIIGDFVNTNIQEALVVNGKEDKRTNMSANPTLIPKGKLNIRYEPDNKLLFITVNSFKEYCAKQQVNYKDTLKQLKDLNVYTETVNKRMGKGTQLDSPAVRALIFDASNSEYLRMDTLENYEDRDSNVQRQLG
jgi:hypothetical protein